MNVVFGSSPSQTHQKFGLVVHVWVIVVKKNELELAMEHRGIKIFATIQKCQKFA